MTKAVVISDLSSLGQIVRLKLRFGCVFFCLLLAACSTGNNTGSKKTDQQIAKNYLQMGIGYMELGKTGVAMERLQYALQLDDRNSAIHDALAVLFQKIEEYDQAKYHFLKAMELDSKNPGAKNNYGRFLCDQGEYDKGMALLKESLALPMNTRKWFSLSNIGICEFNHGDRQSAELHLREALQQFPAYAPALKQMIIISYDKGNYMSARGFLERYLSVKKHTAKTLFYAMLIEKSSGNRQKADKYRDQLLEKFPLSIEARQLN